MPSIIAIIHPSSDEGRRLAATVATESADVRTFASVAAYLPTLTDEGHGCVIVPSDLPDEGTRALIETLRARRLPLSVVVLGSDSDLATAVELVRAGAAEYLPPPLSHRRVLAVVRQALAAHPA